MSVIQISITPSTVFSTIISTLIATSTSIQTQAPGFTQDPNVIDTFIAEVVFIIIVAITALAFICKNRSQQNELKVLKQEVLDQQIVNNVHALQNT